MALKDRRGRIGMENRSTGIDSNIVNIVFVNIMGYCYCRNIARNIFGSI